MAGIKVEAKYEFPDGSVWVRMDDEWGVDITGENGVGGDLVGMESWDFKTREAWQSWGEQCIDMVESIFKAFKDSIITGSEAIDQIYQIDRRMPASIRAQLGEI